MSESFLKTAITTMDVVVTLSVFFFTVFLFFHFGMKRIEKMKEERRRKTNVDYIALWIVGCSCGINNQNVSKIVDKIFASLSPSVKKTLSNSRSSYYKYILSSHFVNQNDVRNLILLCISTEYQKIKKIFDTEKKIQNKLARVKEGKEKITESEFLSYASLIEEKESERARIEGLGERLLYLGLLEEKFLKEFKQFILLYNPEEKANKEGLETDESIRREKPERKEPNFMDQDTD